MNVLDSNTQISTRKSINELFKDTYNKSVKRRMHSYNEEQEQFNNNFNENGCSESILSRKKELCQNSTLQYIVEPQTFIDNLGKSHDKVDEESDFLSRTCSNDEEAMDYDLELNSSWDLFANHQHKHTRECNMQRVCPDINNYIVSYKIINKCFVRHKYLYGIVYETA